MDSSFRSAYSKLAWGREHIKKLKLEIGAFLETPPLECFTEPDPENPDHTIQKIRLARAIPERFSLIAGDAVDNIRAALDHAVYAVAVASAPASTGIVHAAFPFAGSPAYLEDKLKGSRDIPTALWPLFRSLRPYKGGNRLLLALNRACNRNKHALLVSCIGLPEILAASMSGASLIGFPAAHVWNREKNEMVLFTEGPGAHRQGGFDLHFLVALTGIAEDEQAYTALESYAAEVERILCLLETECRRLGLMG